MLLERHCKKWTNIFQLSPVPYHNIESLRKHRWHIIHTRMNCCCLCLDAIYHMNCVHIFVFIEIVIDEAMKRCHQRLTALVRWDILIFIRSRRIIKALYTISTIHARTRKQCGKTFVVNQFVFYVKRSRSLDR